MEQEYGYLSLYYGDIFSLLTKPMICGIITISFLGRGNHEDPSSA
jgi:hypothetical protein